MFNCSASNRRRPRPLLIAAVAGAVLFFSLPPLARAGKLGDLCRKGMRAMGRVLSFGASTSAENNTSLYSADNLKVADYALNLRKLKALATKGVTVTVFEKNAADSKRALVHLEAPNETVYREALRLVEALGFLTPDISNKDGFGGDVAGAMTSFDGRNAGRRSISVLVSKGPVTGLKDAAKRVGFYDPQGQAALLAGLPRAPTVTANDAAKRADEVTPLTTSNRSSMPRS